MRGGEAFSGENNVPPWYISPGMHELETTRHSVYNINYHMVWIPKYRKAILTDDISRRTKELISQIARKHKYKILALEIMPDHIHLFVSAKPNQAPSTIIKIFKGSLARILLKEFSEIRKQLVRAAYGRLLTMSAPLETFLSKP